MKMLAAKSLKAVAVCSVLALVIGVVPAGAAITTYYAVDGGANPGAPLPNSNAAAASFDTAAGALGTVNKIDFESAPEGGFSSMGVAPGVNCTLSNTLIGSGIFDLGTEHTGFNTTAGGKNFVRAIPIDPNSAQRPIVTFDFAEPIQAFGAYLTGVGSLFATTKVKFNDGSDQEFTLTGDKDGGALFFGLTDPTRSISSISFTQGTWLPYVSDSFGVDDVRYVPTAGAVPEPGTLGLLVGGLLGPGLFVFRRRRA